MNKVNITSVGSIETYENAKKTPKHTSFKWNGNYDGKIANIDIRVNNNGKKNKSKITLTNNELIDMLSGPVDSNPIDERLINDFLSDTMPPNYQQSSPIMTSSHFLSPLNDTHQSDLATFSTVMSSKTKKRRHKSKHHKNKSNKRKSKIRN